MPMTNPQVAYVVSHVFSSDNVLTTIHIQCETSTSTSTSTIQAKYSCKKVISN